MPTVVSGRCRNNRVPGTSVEAAIKFSGDRVLYAVDDGEDIDAIQILLEIAGWFIPGQVGLKAYALVQSNGSGMIPVVGVKPNASRM
jgi:hypothetical protein